MGLMIFQGLNLRSLAFRLRTFYDYCENILVKTYFQSYKQLNVYPGLLDADNQSVL